jgi:hypothetical protein
VADRITSLSAIRRQKYLPARNPEMKKISAILFLFASVFMAGCAVSQPIKNIHHEAITQHLTQDQVQNAIIKAGQQKTWIMSVVQPGLIHGQVFVRQHQAYIDIHYTERDYSIDYAGSLELDDDGKGNIHRNYNKWIVLLNEAIQSELARAAIEK